MRKSRYSLVAPEPEQRMYRGIEAVLTESYLKTLFCMALTWYVLSPSFVLLLRMGRGLVFPPFKSLRTS